MASARHPSKAIPRREGRGGALRYMAVCVAGVCLFAQFSSFAHMLLVQHATCPEHGELIHTDGEDADAVVGHVAVASADRARTSALDSESEISDEHGHDHCFVLSHRRENTALIASGSTARAATPVSFEIGDRQVAHPLAPVALYRLAPKNSPPA